MSSQERGELGHLVSLSKGGQGDEHVEELQRNEPDLAAQTRFVQPARAQLLRLI